MQALSYSLAGFVLGLYAYAGTISVYIPLAYSLCGFLIIGNFVLLSEAHVNDRFKDHFFSVPQVVAHVALQYAFVLLVPQIGSVFFGIVFLVFCSGAIRMTQTQATIAWLLMTLGAIPIFLADVPIGTAVNSSAERIVSLAAFVATIGQCVFVGLYGNTMRKHLYKSGVELRLAYSRIEQLAAIDELTASLNRRSIMRALDEEVIDAQQSESPCSIALIDLDWFKRINDLFGHPTGDEVLRTFAITVFANIRDNDKFGRYGGEEFLLIMPATSQVEALHNLNRLRMIIAELDWSALATSMTVTISAGVAALKEDETVDGILARADKALYAAKRAGRNRIESCD